MRASQIPLSFLRLAQVSLLISVYLVDFSNSAKSTDAFSSAKKISFSESVSSPVRHKRAPGNYGHGFYSDDDAAQKLLESRWQRLVDLSQAEKRAPGWGKRSIEEEEDSQDIGMKRAPGWGKRAPGWGKRAPGWGKRAPGWGKRAPGWGKRSLDEDECQALARIVDENLHRAYKADSMRIAKCGSGETINETARK